jgi:hypothetical protein
MESDKQLGKTEKKRIAEELRQITPPNVELLKLADRFPAPQEWYDEDFAGLFDLNTTNTAVESTHAS